MDPLDFDKQSQAAIEKYIANVKERDTGTAGKKRLVKVGSGATEHLECWDVNWKLPFKRLAGLFTGGSSLDFVKITDFYVKKGFKNKDYDEVITKYCESHRGKFTERKTETKGGVEKIQKVYTTQVTEGPKPLPTQEGLHIVELNDASDEIKRQVKDWFPEIDKVAEPHRSIRCYCDGDKLIGIILLRKIPVDAYPHFKDKVGASPLYDLSIRILPDYQDKGHDGKFFEQICKEVIGAGGNIFLLDAMGSGIGDKLLQVKNIKDQFDVSFELYGNIGNRYLFQKRTTERSKIEYVKVNLKEAKHIPNLALDPQTIHHAIAYLKAHPEDAKYFDESVFKYAQSYVATLGTERQEEYKKQLEKLRIWCAFAAVRSNNPVKVASLPTKRDGDDGFLKAAKDGKWETAPPILARSTFVSEAMVSHLMRDKKDCAIGTKYEEGDKITNMEGAIHTFLTPVTPITMTGDYAYRGRHALSHFQAGSGRQVIMSAAVQPDFEYSNVVLPLVEVKEKEEVIGKALPSDFKPLWEQVGHNLEKLKEKMPGYEKELREHMVYHLTRSHKLPERKDVTIHNRDAAKEFLEQLIEKPTVDLIGALQKQCVDLPGHVISLEALFQLYIQQMQNEFAVLEKMLPQGYVYTIDPPAIFAGEIGTQNVDILNRLQILALQHLKQQGFPFNNLKIIAFNDYADKTAIGFIEKIFGPEKVKKKAELFQGDGGKYSSNDSYALVLHNNSDGFGQNIESEAPTSMDGVIGSYSDAACHLQRDRADLLTYVTTAKEMLLPNLAKPDLLPKMNYLRQNVMFGGYPSDPDSDVKATDMMQALLDEGVTDIISLMEEKEVRGETGKKPFKDYKKVAERLAPKKIAFENLEIPDVETIDDKTVEEFIKEKLLKLAADPTKKIYIHCHGGNGRSSIITTALLSRLEHISFEEALERVFRSSLTRVDPLRPYLPESEKQFEQMKALCFKPDNKTSDLTFEGWRAKCKKICREMRPDLTIRDEILDEKGVIKPDGQGKLQKRA